MNKRSRRWPRRTLLVLMLHPMALLGGRKAQTWAANEVLLVAAHARSRRWVRRRQCGRQMQRGGWRASRYWQTRFYSLPLATTREAGCATREDGFRRRATAREAGYDDAGGWLRMADDGGREDAGGWLQATLTTITAVATSKRGSTRCR